MAGAESAIIQSNSAWRGAEFLNGVTGNVTVGQTFFIVLNALCVLFLISSISSTEDDKTKNRGHMPRMPPECLQGSALSGPRASLAGRVALGEHGGYLCARCRQSWTSLSSLTHRRTSPYMWGIKCEEVKNTMEIWSILQQDKSQGSLYCRQAYWESLWTCINKSI